MYVQLEVSPGVHKEMYRIHLPNPLPAHDLPAAFWFSVAPLQSFRQKSQVLPI